MADIYNELVEIVGEQSASNRKEERYFYGRDPGVTPPQEPDYVVLPDTVEQVQGILRLANRERIAVVPKGGGLAITGLVVPQKGGIVMDLKRMGRILEVNEKARYVVVEGGTTHGALQSYLKRHHPQLRHSIPDAPPITTIAGNAVIHGQGRLTQQYGFNSDMVTGLEVVLATGEVCKIGSCSLSPYWFSKGAPLPDLSGLFLGWFGTTGVITKLGLRLYPCKEFRDVLGFVTDRVELVPDIFLKLSHTEMVEDILCEVPLRPKGCHNIMIHITGDSDQELAFKTSMVWDALREYFDSKDGGFMSLPSVAKGPILEMPMRSGVTMADVRRGGGFVYGGGISPIEKYPALVAKVEEIAAKHRLSYGFAARVISGGNCMMVPALFMFNRADPDEMERVRQALREMAEFYLEEGAVVWKASKEEQDMMIERMDPTVLRIMRAIKETLDPNGIMNPGNWEV